jgi:hypothetical protein
MIGTSQTNWSVQAYRMPNGRYRITTPSRAPPSKQPSAIDGARTPRCILAIDSFEA